MFLHCMFFSRLSCNLGRFYFWYASRILSLPFCQYLLPGDDAQKHLHVKSHWELSLYTPGKCTNISGWSLDITSPMQQGATPDDAPWVGMWWHSHLEDVCSGCLWWGTVLIISGTSGWVCKMYPTGVWHQQNSYRQWAERGLGFCLREKTWK